VAEITYALCALTAFFCAWLLLQAYRERRITLLLWSGVFFSIQACNNVFLIFDKVVLPNIDLSVYRYAVALIANAILLYGLIMRTEVD
jgi:hypothetical protein